MILGAQLPRIECIPEYSTTAAKETIELAALAGLGLDPWQCYTLSGAMGKRPDHKWAAFEVLIIVSRQNGKGAILEARELAGLYLINTDRLLIHTAHEHKTSSEHYRRILFLIENTPELDKKVARQSSAYGREFIELKAGPTVILGSGGHEILRKERSRLIFIARSAGSGRGFTGDLLVYDEDMILDAEKVAASIPSLSARPNPQVWYTGSAGIKTSTMLANVRRRMVARSSPRLAGYEWSINWHDDFCQPDCLEHDDPYDPASLARANPALGIRISGEFLEAEREAFAGNEAAYLRERLGVGQYPAPLDGWLIIPRKWWLATLDKSDEPPRVRHPVFAVDVTPDRESAAIAVAGQRPDGLTGVQIVDHRPGVSWIAARCKEIEARWHPDKWIVDRRAAAGSLVTDLEKLGLDIETVGATEVAHACGQLYDGFRDNALRHYGQGILKAAIAGVDKRQLSESWAFDRRSSAVDICPLMSAVFAHWGYMQFGAQADYDASESVHFDIAEIIRYCRAGIYGPADIQRLYAADLIDDKGLETLADAGIPI